MIGRGLRLATLGFSLALLFVLVFSAMAIADVPTNVDAYGSTGSAAGVHPIYYTGEFTNFSTGAVDNRYPMAVVHQDIAPSSYATASNEDYGPLGAAVGPTANFRVPYAVAQFPPNSVEPADSTCCTQAGSAEAHARELTSNAKGTYSGSPDQGTTFSNALAETTTTMNPDGTLDVVMHAHVGSATFGGASGLVIHNVDVVAKVHTDGVKAIETATVAPGQATFAGQPVSITDQGVTVGGNQVPGLTPGTSVAGPTFKVFTVAPQKETDGGHGTVSASGVHVVVTAPTPSGVPANQVEYVLAEGSADAFVNPAQLAPPVSSELSNLAPVATDTSASTGLSLPPSVALPPSTNIAPPAVTKKPALRLVSTIADRLPIAPMFFVWEALVLGSAASIVWARRQSSVVP